MSPVVQLSYYDSDGLYAMTPGSELFTLAY